jgi:lipid II:glycine glycyltransferase (peptidoglycan interpeptide bridge formation enzyme)
VYYSVYEDAHRRWGDRATSHYDFELFKNIFEMKSPNIKLWLAKAEQRIIAGALVMYWNRHVVWWHGASLEEYFHYCAANLLNVEIIKNACERGYLYYDFNPSGGHEGVASFKQSFGAERRTIWRWDYQAPRKPKRALKGLFK